MELVENDIMNIRDVTGIGGLLTTAISSNDYSVVIALSFVYSALYIVVMLILDLVYCIADPRVRLGGKAE